jgi:transglutaminase-like putative cysteine protease
VTRGQQLASLPFSVALAAASGCAFHRVFAWQALAPVLAVAAVIPVLVVLPLSARRRPSPLAASTVACVVAWVLAVSATLFRRPGPLGLLPSPATLGAVAGALRNSWTAMLTTILPAPASPRLLVLVSALVWLAAFAGAEASLRTRSAAAPLLPAFAVLVVALLLGVDGPGSNLMITAVLILLAGACLVIRSPRQQARSAVLALPAAGVVTAAALAAGPHLPFVHSSAPFDPRERMPAPPPSTRQAISPLDEISGWLLAPHKLLFTVRASAPENWRLAVLDRFDGTTWSSSGQLFPTGARVPPGTGPPGRTPVTQVITIRGLPGVWLPAADRPAAVTGTGVDVDPASGILADPRPLHPGLHYQVVSEVARYSQAALARARPASGSAARADLALPGDAAGHVAAELSLLRRIARQAIAGSTTPFQEALRLASYLQSHEVYDVTAAPGHTYRTIEFFLVTTHHGTSEQFATAFAVLARLVGLPSRVAVGFRPGTPSSQPGSWNVYSGDVLAWPEVDFSDLGWVPFYPTPEQSGPHTRRQAVPMGEPGNRLRMDRGITQSGRSPATGHHRPEPSARPGLHLRGTGRWWLIPLPALTGLALGYAGAVIITPALRRRRRRRLTASPARVVGAWHQVLEDLSRAGVVPSPALTAREVAGLPRMADGQIHDHLLSLAQLVNEVRFAPPHPGAASPPAADAAWRHADAVRALITRSTRLTRRVLRRLHPRSLRTPRHAHP